MAMPPSVAGSSTHSGGAGSLQAATQLFARLNQEIEEHHPKNCIHFIVDFLCKHYPEHLHGFASIWQMDPDLEAERHEVVHFFKAHKISTAVAAHFTNAGYDTLDTLTTLTPESLLDIEAFNNVKWLPGHKVRLQQIFQEISARVRVYRDQRQKERAAGGPAALPHTTAYTAAATPSPAVTYRSPPMLANQPMQAPMLALPSTTAPTMTGMGYNSAMDLYPQSGPKATSMLGPTEWQFRARFEGA